MESKTHLVLLIPDNKVLFTGTQNECREWLNEQTTNEYTSSIILKMTREERKTYNNAKI